MSLYLCVFEDGRELAGVEVGPYGAFNALRQTVADLVAERPLQLEYAAVLVDLQRMQPVTVRAAQVTAAHLLASCAVPGAVGPQKIDGRWYVDGGLLNPLPLWAAVEMGATRIVALQALPEIPSLLLRPFVKGFRAVFGYHPALPAGVELSMITPHGTLGTLRDAYSWKRENVDRWIAQGAADVKKHFHP